MKLIINASNLFGGGGIQVALSFIYECININDNEYHVFLCPRLDNQIDFSLFPSNFNFYRFPFPPSPFLKGLLVTNRLAKLEAEIKPDCVFSIFGPTYWTPKSVHLMGYAIPHFLYSESPFFNIISLKEKLKWKLLYTLKKYYFLKNSCYYHVETEDAKLRLSRYLNCPLNRINTISNTYNSIYDNEICNSIKRLPFSKDANFRFICLSAYYLHKNIEILNEVIPLLRNRGFEDIKFILTIDDHIYARIFSEVSKLQIINVGPQHIKDCIKLYNECDAVFLPTLLECFSANYPEAMKMQKPILTSNLSFARDVCADAALYFNPLDANDIVNSIIKLVSDSELRSNLITNGNKQLKTFLSANERALRYLEVCNQIAVK